VPVSQTFAVVVGEAQPATPITITPKGALPGSIIAGQPSKIHESVTLTATQDIDTNGAISLNLSPSSGFGSSFSVAAVGRHFKLKTGKHLVVTLSAKQIPADVAGGTYTVNVAVTDTNSQAAVAETGQTVTVLPPTVNLSGSFKTLATHARSGHHASGTVLIVNSGNSEASGVLKLDVTKSTDHSLLEEPSKVVHIKPGKSVAIHLSWNAGASGEQYFADVQIDPNNAFGDVDQSNNTIVSAAEITVS
jgi:hypothetical protein